MRPALPLLLSLASVLPCAGQEPATVHYDGLNGGARFSNGYVIGWNSPKNTEITFYRADGKPIYTLSTRGGDHVHHYGAWVIDSDGIAARVYQGIPAWEGFIELLDLSGKPIRTIKTGT